LEGLLLSCWAVWNSSCRMIVLVSACAIGVAAPPQQPGGVQPPASAAVRTTLNRYCIGCHNTKAKIGGFTLDSAAIDDVGEHAEQWEKVVRKLRPRYMPPAGLPRPDERTYDALVSSLESALDSAAKASPNPGRTDTFRRLNRTEYQNAVRDLLALDVDVSALLPSDESTHRFANVTV